MFGAKYSVRIIPCKYRVPTYLGLSSLSLRLISLTGRWWRNTWNVICLLPQWMDRHDFSFSLSFLHLFERHLPSPSASKHFAMLSAPARTPRLLLISAAAAVILLIALLSFSESFSRGAVDYAHKAQEYWKYAKLLPLVHPLTSK